MSTDPCDICGGAGVLSNGQWCPFCRTSPEARLDALERRIEALERAVRQGPDPRLWAGDAHDPAV